MTHSFDIEIAKKYGINEALIYNHFLYDRTSWYAFVKEPYELSKISNTERLR